MADISETKTLSFNPYSAGNCSGRLKNRPRTHPRRRHVSILILLEIALEENAGTLL